MPRSTNPGGTNLAVRLDAVLEAVQLPAAVAHLDAALCIADERRRWMQRGEGVPRRYLADVNGDCVAHG